MDWVVCHAVFVEWKNEWGRIRRDGLFLLSPFIAVGWFRGTCDSWENLLHDPEMSWERSVCNDFSSLFCFRQPDLRKVPRWPELLFFTQQTILGNLLFTNWERPYTALSFQSLDCFSSLPRVLLPQPRCHDQPHLPGKEAKGREVSEQPEYEPLTCRIS